MSALTIQTPAWSEPLLAPARYKGAKGGRGSGKSHFFAELCVEEMVADPNLQFVCLREIQKSLKFSAKKLIEQKIQDMKVGHLFDVTLTEIRRRGGQGIVIFQGIQDHTAESIKSLEGFNRAWVEEAQSVSVASLEKLLPTIRSEGSEIWFSWNPSQSTDPVDQLLCGERADPDAVVVHVNYTENPFLPATLKAEIEKHKERSPQTFAHVWLGEYQNGGADSVIPLSWAMRAVSRWNDLNSAGMFTDSLPIGAIGVDVADQGDDKTVLAPRSGNWVPRLYEYANQDTMQTAGLVTAWGKKWPKATAMVDVIGIGAGVVSRCREQGVRVIGFNASESSDRKDKAGIMEFLNKRSAAWWNMREMLDPANGHDIAIPDDAELIGDLTAPRWKLSSSGKIQVEGASPTVLFPEGLRARLGRSPDKGTAVIQAFWTPVSREIEKPTAPDNRPKIAVEMIKQLQGIAPRKGKPAYRQPTRS